MPRSGDILTDRVCYEQNVNLRETMQIALNRIRDKDKLRTRYLYTYD